MNLKKQWELAMTEEFFRRVQQAMVRTALNVAAEKLPSPKRSSYATQILNNPEGYRMRFAHGVVAYPGISEESTDDNIQLTVNSIFNAYAGAYQVGTSESSLNTDLVRMLRGEEGVWAMKPWYKKLGRKR